MLLWPATLTRTRHLEAVFPSGGLRLPSRPRQRDGQAIKPTRRINPYFQRFPVPLSPSRNGAGEDYLRHSAAMERASEMAEEIFWNVLEGAWSAAGAEVPFQAASKGPAISQALRTCRAVVTPRSTHSASGRSFAASAASVCRCSWLCRSSSVFRSAREAMVSCAGIRGLCAVRRWCRRTRSGLSGALARLATSRRRRRRIEGRARRARTSGRCPRRAQRW